MYAVVEFTEERSVGIVCTNWLKSDTMSFWPRLISISNIRQMLVERKAPDEDWSVVPVRILRNNIG